LKTLKNLLDQCHTELEEMKQDLSKLRPPELVEEQNETQKRPLLSRLGKKFQGGVKMSHLDNPVKRVEYALSKDDLDHILGRIERNKNTFKAQLSVLQLHKQDGINI
jgi:hypothetical protein